MALRGYKCHCYSLATHTMDMVIFAIRTNDVTRRKVLRAQYNTTEILKKHFWFCDGWPTSKQGIKQNKTNKYSLGGNLPCLCILITNIRCQNVNQWQKCWDTHFPGYFSILTPLIRTLCATSNNFVRFVPQTLSFKAVRHWIGEERASKYVFTALEVLARTMDVPRSHFV